MFEEGVGFVDDLGLWEFVEGVVELVVGHVLGVEQIDLALESDAVAAVDVLDSGSRLLLGEVDLGQLPRLRLPLEGLKQIGRLGV